MSELTTTEAQQELRNLRQQAKEIAAEEKGKSTEIPVDKPEPPDGVEVKRAFTEDVKDDTLDNARDAGKLSRGNTRLNILSRLSSGEDVDHFKFNTDQPGKTQLSRLGSRDVDVQLLDKFGNVFADSSANPDSEEYQNYTRLMAGEMTLQPDSYAVRVERPDDVDSDETLNYGVQLKQEGGFTKDLDTVESNDPYQRDKIEEGPRAQAFGNAQQLTKETTDVKGESLDNARDIGRLVENRSRLNVITTLRNGEEADHYKFDVHREGKGRLSVLNQKDAQVELLDKEGNTVASSTAEDGSDAARNYEKLIKGQFQFEKGEYNIRVKPAEDSDIAKGEAEGGGRTFGLQLTQGERFVNDYNVIEQGTKESSKDASRQYDQLARLGERQAAQGVVNMLNTLGNPYGNNGVTSILGSGGGAGGIMGAVSQANQSQYNTQVQQLQSQTDSQLPLGGAGGGGGGGKSGGGVNTLL